MAERADAFRIFEEAGLASPRRRRKVTDRARDARSKPMAVKPSGAALKAIDIERFA